MNHMIEELGPLKQITAENIDDLISGLKPYYDPLIDPFWKPTFKEDKRIYAADIILLEPYYEIYYKYKNNKKVRTSPSDKDAKSGIICNIFIINDITGNDKHNKKVYLHVFPTRVHDKIVSVFSKSKTDNNIVFHYEMGGPGNFSKSSIMKVRNLTVPDNLQLHDINKAVAEYM